jgi:ribosomal protein L25 (general stress protein Ctc)
MDIKGELEVIYAGLQGLYSEVPKSVDLDTKEVWEQYHNYIEDLIRITNDKTYLSYKVGVYNTQSPYFNKHYVHIDEYRSKLNSLIRVLHAKYFKEQNNPFNVSPNTLINLSQQQSQTQVMVLEIQSFLDKKLYTGSLEEKEKTFVEKIKGNLPNIKSTLELINTIISTAGSLGLDLNKLAKIFGL